MFQTEPNIPRLDAGKGLFLKGDGAGSFKATSIRESGFTTPMDAKKMELVKTIDERGVLVVNSEGILQFFRITEN